jgi:hypothetical protein
LRNEKANSTDIVDVGVVCPHIVGWFRLVRFTDWLYANVYELPWNFSVPWVRIMGNIHPVWIE